MKAIKIPNCSFSGYYSLYKSDGVLVVLLVPGLWGSDNQQGEIHMFSPGLTRGAFPVFPARLSVISCVMKTKGSSDLLTNQENN